ncbi:uncharacterized protein CLUP02_13402 [Colletotrichum lupini]|uniref:Uncharacterized protein n=1 Tax=Colletotrichum lupini TaxID=145971 RepID=A0A9Q8T482_9PEZI|nr:uncharacterized protein CLUP02_13402 [Colletotrichum lupini]UQC87881.1 hypothetical protein CLUP02_13402 [Colletotrichum lupini]
MRVLVTYLITLDDVVDLYGIGNYCLFSGCTSTKKIVPGSAQRCNYPPVSFEDDSDDETKHDIEIICIHLSNRVPRKGLNQASHTKTLTAGTVTQFLFFISSRNANFSLMKIFHVNELITGRNVICPDADTNSETSREHPLSLHESIPRKDNPRLNHKRVILDEKLTNLPDIAPASEAKGQNQQDKITNPNKNST